MISSRASERLRTLTFLCALLVVVIHCQSMKSWFAGEMPVGKLEAAFYFLGTYSVAHIAVPVFFVVTGFFLVKDYPLGGWFVGELKKRSVTLYVPFLLWNVLNVLLALLAGRSLGDGGIGTCLAKIFGYDMYVQPGCGQFWYLQTIFLYVFAAPLAFPLLRNKGQGLLLIGVFFAGWVGTFWYYLPLPLAAGNFMWLSIGSWVGFRMRDVEGFRRLSKAVLDRRRLLLVVFGISIVCKVLFGVCRCKIAFDITDKVLVFSGVWAAFANIQMLDAVSPLCRRFVGLTFFIYAIHSLMISAALRIGLAFHVQSLTMYLMKISFGWGGSVLVGILLRHYFPKTFNILTGGRS